MKKIFLATILVMASLYGYAQYNTNPWIDGFYGSSNNAQELFAQKTYHCIARGAEYYEPNQVIQYRWTLYHPAGYQYTYTLYEGKQPYMYFAIEGYYRLTLQIHTADGWGPMAELSFYVDASMPGGSGSGGSGNPGIPGGSGGDKGDLNEGEEDPNGPRWP